MIIKLKLDNVKQAFAKSRDGQTKWMCFLIEDDELLEKYNTICDKATLSIINVFEYQNRILWR